MKRCAAACRNSVTETPRLKFGIGGNDRLGQIEETETSAP